MTSRYDVVSWAGHHVWWVMDREHKNDNGTTGRVVPGSVISHSTAEFQTRAIAAALNAEACDVASQEIGRKT